MRNVQLDVVLPCYNPLSGWAETVAQAFHSLQEALPEVEIFPIIINDGSSNGLSEEDQAYLASQFPTLTFRSNPENRGKGYTLREGFRLATHPYCIFTDIDFPYTEESFLAVFRRLTHDQSDIVIGIKDDTYYRHLPPFRIVISKGLRWLARNLLRISITDTQCGLKGFNEKGKEVLLSTTIDRYLCDLECIFLADRNAEIKMETQMIHLKEGVEFSTVNPRILFWEGLNFLQILVKSYRLPGRKGH